MAKNIGTFTQSAGNIRNLGIDFTPDLWAGETLSTVDIPNVVGVTISGAVVNSATFASTQSTIVAIGKGVLFTANMPTAGTFTLVATVTTSTGETIIVEFTIEVT